MFKSVYQIRKWTSASGGMEACVSEVPRALDAMPGVELKILALKGTANGFSPVLADNVDTSGDQSRRNQKYKSIVIIDNTIFNCKEANIELPARIWGSVQ